MKLCPENARIYCYTVTIEVDATGANLCRYVVAWLKAMLGGEERFHVKFLTDKPVRTSARADV